MASAKKKKGADISHRAEGVRESFLWKMSWALKEMYSSDMRYMRRASKVQGMAYVKTWRYKSQNM